MHPESSDDTFRIGTLAREAGVGIETIRYYEREGLLPEPPRRGAVHHRGYRVYDADHLRRLRFILRAKGLGFTLKEIAALLSLRAEGPASCDSVREQASRHLADVEARLRDLRRIQRALQHLVERCGTGGDPSSCPILDYLEPERR